MWALLTFYAVIMIRNAWLSDDAIITFRPIENFLAGYGLGYNPFVRVQAFTHPLWMFALSLVYFIARMFLPSLPSFLFYVAFLVSIFFSLATVYLLLTRVSNPNILSLTLATLILTLSNGFIDFSTSGLENPLTNFLLVVFALAFFADEPDPLRLSALAALIALNRMDVVLIVAPALALVLWRAKERRKTLGRMALGFLPFLLWELFSLFYFGFAFPNTAYAKLNTGISKKELILQGLDYFFNAVNWDAVTVLGIALAAFAVYLTCKKKDIALFGGATLYLLYIVWIGGDFFASRLLSAPLLVSVVILSKTLTERRHQRLALGMIILLGAFSIRSPLLSSNMVAYFPDYPISDFNAVSDQRLEYFGNARKKNFYSLAENGFRNSPWGSDYSGSRWRFVGVKSVYAARALGYVGYMKGPSVYVIDEYALADALLARLPASRWEIGHFLREIPEGYLETLDSGRNQIADANLALYYEKLNFVTTAPLTDWNRIAEIWKFNTGQYDYLIEAYVQRPQQ